MVLNNALVKLGLSNNGQTFVDCPLANISQCETSENNRKFTILIYNPLPRPIQKYIRIPTVTNDYQIYQSSSLIEVDYALVYDETKSIPERHSKANYDLIFKANLPATGFVTYTATAPSSVTPNTNLNKESHVKKTKFNENFAIRNEYLQLIFDSNGNLIEIDNMDTEISTALSQSYCVYQSMPGNNSKPEFHASGAYVFRPLVSSCNPLSVKQYSLYRGSQYAELHQVFNDWISQTIRLYSDVKHVEFEWQVGPIPADKENKIGQEIVIKFDTDINSDSLFYTDSNGREMLQRKRDYRPTWNLNQTEKIAGNYYPINSRIFIKDEGEGHNRQLTLVTDRSHGGSSIQDGSIEVMLHRRTLCDDALGVGEPLNEKGSDGKPMIAKGVISLIFNTTSQSARLHRELAHHINNRPLLLFSNESVNSISNLIDLPQISLPSNLHLLTFLKEIGSPTNSYIVRIEHFYEKDEDSLLSQPVTINLEQVFSNLFKLKAVQELALGANMDVDELNNRLKWNTNNFFKDQSSKTSNGKSIFDYEFTFETMQIRTFRLFI
jgi:lysosomal alpha-mannosidase